MNHRVVIVIVPLLLFLSCSTPRVVQSDKSEQAIQRHPRFSYAGITLQGIVGIKAFDQSSQWDSLLTRVDGSYYVKALSPSRDRMAIAYKTRDSLKVSLITFHPITLTPLSSSGRDNEVALVWKDDNSTLFFNYYLYHWKKGGDLSNAYPQNLGSYYVNTDSMKLHYLKFSNGSVIECWLPTGFLVTSHNETRYFINLKTGRPAYTLRHFKKLSFSPDGKKCFYFKDQPTMDTDGREYNIPELFLADFNGKNSKKIAEYNYRPQNAVWAPDSRTIAFDVQSQQWSNIRHLVFCDVETGESTIDRKEDQITPHSITEPHYSPSGRRIFYYVKRGDEYLSYAQLDAVVRDYGHGRSIVLRSMVAGDYSRPVGGFIDWYDDDNLVLAATGWIGVFNVPSQTETSLTEWPLHLWQSH